MPFEGQPIHLTDVQRDDLEEIARSNALPAGFVQRARIAKMAGAQDARDGFYAGLQLGAAIPAAVSAARQYVSHPTRCDGLLYPPSVNPPIDDPACLDNTLTSRPVCPCGSRPRAR